MLGEWKNIRLYYLSDVEKFVGMKRPVDAGVASRNARPL
jgi:hypothetical protein